MDQEYRMILKMEHISKSFPGVKALEDVDLHLREGEVLALLGENGAGKSTLMKILSGAYMADSGTIWIDGKKAEYHEPSDATDMGVRIIYQELNNLPDMSIAENIYLGNWPKTGPMKKIDYKKLKTDCMKLLREVGLDIDPFTDVRSLSVAQKQLVEIAKSLSGELKILVMDEPTSSLNEVETQNLFQIIRKLKQEGKSIIYISHRMDEIICMMVGRTITDMYPKIEVEKGEEVLKVEHLTNSFLKDVSFDVKRGEIVGLFGLMGAGRTNIAEAIFGARRMDSGTIWVNGKEGKIHSPKEAMKHKIAYLSCERKLDGLLLEHSVAENILMASIPSRLGRFRLKLNREREIAGKWVRELNIKTPKLQSEVKNLSGGNQQKVVLAKALETEPDVLILNEPTRGIDVGAKIEIYNLMESLCKKGMAIVMISSELPEIMGIADRIIVVCEGRITGGLKRDEFSAEALMEYAIGGKEDGK
ncbi:MAG: sugar ABC transporter ATP-binding protein [Lachnospiraceae bacterium]|nr:sugar ABC transporter ATP-binding protein [Lachnospiraceae bacterium]